MFKKATKLLSTMVIVAGTVVEISVPIGFSQEVKAEIQKE